MPPAGDYWQLTFGSGPQIIQLDYSVEYTPGNPSICLEPHTSADANAAREVDGTWLNVAVGDNIVASCWILCGDSSTGDTSPYAGARLGIDLYAHTSAGYGIVDSYPHDGTEDMNSFVNWGTNTWTLKTWDITIPSTYYTTDLSNGRTCNPVQIDSFVLWLQVLQPTDAGLAWFAASQLYINPT